MDEALVSTADLKSWIERVAAIDLELAVLRRERWDIERRLAGAEMLWPEKLAALKGEPPEAQK